MQAIFTPIPKLLLRHFANIKFASEDVKRTKSEYVYSIKNDRLVHNDRLGGRGIRVYDYDLSDNVFFYR